MLATVLTEARTGILGAPASLTVEGYSRQWLAAVRHSLKPRTLDSYTDLLRLHVLPDLGPVRLRNLHPGVIRPLIAAKLGSGLSRNTVRLIHAALRSMLSAAVEEGLLPANPAQRLGRLFRLASRSARQREVRALDASELRAFLLAAQGEPRYEVLFRLLAQTGLRLGEALALRWEDVDARAIRVERTLSGGREGSPKSGRGRTVEIPAGLADRLRTLRMERLAEKMRLGWRSLPALVFVSAKGGRIPQASARKAFRRVLVAAGLRSFTPHSLRHSYASLMLQRGASLHYVERQLGHADISLTADTYGRHLPLSERGAADALDTLLAESGQFVVSLKATGTAPNPRKSLKGNGAGGRGRTDGLLITNWGNRRKPDDEDPHGGQFTNGEGSR